MPELRDQVNAELERSSGKRYNGTIQVRHIARLLYEGVGLAGLEEQVRVSLAGFKFGAQYGCHYLKPSESFDGFDSAETPHTLDDLIRITGAEAVDYRTKLDCCGGGILAADEEVALAMPRAKLQDLKESGADAMVLVCPFCDVMYEYNQRRIEKAANINIQLPVLFYPQVLGLALGIPAEELGFKLNRVKSKELNQKLAALAS